MVRLGSRHPGSAILLQPKHSARMVLETEEKTRSTAGEELGRRGAK